MAPAVTNRRDATMRRRLTPRTWVVAAIGCILGAWLTFDGSRAFVVGDYVTPASGEYAGQLGPWSALVSAMGLQPRSAVMKSVHVGLGLSWLAASAGLLLGTAWARRGVLWCAVLSLWYLPFGTIFGVVQILLLRRPGTFSSQN